MCAGAGHRQIKPEGRWFISDEWERLEVETNASWNAFCLYRDYGRERGILKTLALNGIPSSRYGAWCKWSAKYDWVKRCGAYDVYLDGIRRAEREKEYVEQERKYLAATGLLLEKGKQKLESMECDEVTQNNALEYIKTAFDIERTIYGKDGKGSVDDGIPRQLEIIFDESFRDL